MITIYTDGSSKGNPGPGGCAAYLSYRNHIKELSSAFETTTNNRMELMAVILALEVITKKDHPVRLYTDSMYITNAIHKGWLQRWLKNNFKGKKNKDLWSRFWKLYQQHKKITLHWVKGHAGNPLNERCNDLAMQAAENGPWQKDHGYLATQKSLSRQ